MIDFTCGQWKLHSPYYAASCEHIVEYAVAEGKKHTREYGLLGSHAHIISQSQFNRILCCWFREKHCQISLSQFQSLYWGQRISPSSNVNNSTYCLSLSQTLYMFCATMIRFTVWSFYWNNNQGPGLSSNIAYFVGNKPFLNPNSFAPLWMS
jgi:hypothetical protein